MGTDTDDFDDGDGDSEDDGEAEVDPEGDGFPSSNLGVEVSTQSMRNNYSQSSVIELLRCSRVLGIIE
jgi:hypothetical protein